MLRWFWKGRPWLAALLVIAWSSVALGAGQSNPVALVEDIVGDDLPVELLDYLYEGQSFDLGRSGAVAVAYFEPCMREVIVGGRVRIGRSQSRVSQGKVTRETIDCVGGQVALTEETAEIGGAVKRVTPFKPAEWREVVVKSEQPIFKWSQGGGRASVTLVDLDGPRLRILWQVETRKSFVVYPTDAPKLRRGMPYLIEVRVASGAGASAVFSIDPALNVGPGAAARLVPLGR